MGPRGWRLRWSSRTEKRSVPYRFRLSPILILLLTVLSSRSGNEDAPTGAWDSIHVFEANERGRTAHYKLTSTVMLHLVTQSKVERNGQKGEKAAAESEAGDAEKDASGHAAGSGSITLSGSMTRQVGSAFSCSDYYPPLSNDNSYVCFVDRARPPTGRCLVTCCEHRSYGRRAGATYAKHTSRRVFRENSGRRRGAARSREPRADSKAERVAKGACGDVQGEEISDL